MKKLMIVIVDTVAKDIVGPITLHRNHVTAMRMWDDVCRMEGKSQVAMHIADHELRCIGYLDEDDVEMNWTPSNEVLINGQQWLASQQQQEEQR